MARTWQEIYDEITAGAQAVTAFNALEPSADNSSKFLEDIKTVSKLGVWRAYAFLVATYHYLQELRFDDHIAEVEQTIAQGQYGTVPWWELKALEYQHGDLIIEQNGALLYEVIDEAARIVTVVAVTRVGGSVEIKVAKGELSALVPLSVAERAGISSYASKIKPVGEDILIVSQQPDLLKLSAEVYYKATAGLAAVTAAVELAVNTYLAQLKFAGVFTTNTLIDRVQEVAGVVDVKITTLQAKEDGGTFLDVDRVYESAAGYMKADSSHPLSSNLSYIAS